VILSVLLLVGGLVALTLGADRFVVSAARISESLGISPILIGALVIGLGTSAPEMLVSALAAGRGEIDIAVGNIVGSNTANMTLVLGATALVAPAVARTRTIRREGFTMFVGLVALSVLLWDRTLTRWEAIGLGAGMLVAAAVLVYWARTDVEEGLVSPEKEWWEGSVGREVSIGLATLAVTLVGADLLVRGASRLAADLGITAAFVGLVIVAVGTSLPELATAMAAARRGETDLVLGNVLGSNLFNSLAVAAIAGLIGPGAVSDTFRPALGFMVGAGALAGFLVWTGRRLERWEGAILLAVFLAFVALAAA
jgi:cation:H+ antiporter